MKKQINKYATFWGVLGGTALAYIYIKTLGKDKGLQLTKTLLIGAGIGTGVGLGIDLFVNNKPKPVTEDDVKKMAESIGSEAKSEVDGYLSLMKLAKLSESDNQRVLNVVNAVLLAQKDKKWDAKADLTTKKKVLSGYGISDDDFNVFENVIVKGVSNIIVGAFEKKEDKVKKTSKEVKSQDGKFYEKK